MQKKSASESGQKLFFFALLIARHNRVCAYESGFAVEYGGVCRGDVVGAFESDNPIPSRNRDFALWGAV